MSPKHYKITACAISHKKSKGFLVPFSAILVVGIAILALAISDISSQSSQASTVEGLSAQAFYAAESGAYYGMNQVMFDVDDRSIANANCAALSGNTINFSAEGLQLCSTQVQCSVSTAASSPESFYVIRSSAVCGAGDTFAERVVEVSSSL